MAAVAPPRRPPLTQPYPCRKTESTTLFLHLHAAATTKQQRTQLPNHHANAVNNLQLCSSAPRTSTTPLTCN
ncbi:hypothetical protein DEO72_LG2g3476 [Vigna unguiculata]|uniref:Uncharacterized protein n=1 Tax=Vigna unguiculata TaxID=3917 RepID=A0A4D6L3P8_VIGUN|nr:hypothetical protein DEO72_LG2g3476 [Vigna unguiculata]